MAKLVSFLGKLIFFGVFVAVGVNLIHNKDTSSKQLEKSYDRFFFALKKMNVTLPQTFRPGAVRLHSKSIVNYTGYALVGSSVLSVIGVSYVSFVISLFLILQTAIFHNPILANDGLEFNNELSHCFLNLALLGGSFIFFSQSQRQAKPLASQKAAETSAPSKPQTNQPKQNTHEKPEHNNKKGHQQGKNKRD